jgi:hypothetical protein
MSSKVNGNDFAQSHKMAAAMFASRWKATDTYSLAITIPARKVGRKNERKKEQILPSIIYHFRIL